LFLHFVGLVFGAGPGIASLIIGRAIASAPAERAVVLKGLPPVFAKVSLVGLALLWATGLTMVWSVYGGPSNLPPLFWVKLVFVLTLTAAAIATPVTYAQIGKTGNDRLIKRVQILGPVAGLSALLVVLFAVLAFS
jgi:hypothetical protein